MISESVQKELKRLERRTTKEIRKLIGSAGSAGTDEDITKTFNTVSDLEAFAGKDGNRYRLLGYYEPGDFGQPLELICGEKDPDDDSVVLYEFSNGLVAKMFNEGPINVLWYGAKNDNTNPATTTAAVKAAINEAGAYFNEGRTGWVNGRAVFFPRGEYAISGYVVVENGVTLIGETYHPGGVKVWDIANHSTKLRLNRDAEDQAIGLRVKSNVTIQGLVIQHGDIEFGDIPSANYTVLQSMQNNGYAIYSDEQDSIQDLRPPYMTHGYGVCIRDCIIAGFNTAVFFRSTAQQGGRYRLENVLIDSWNGVNIIGTGDICRLRDVHCWPLLDAFTPVGESVEWEKTERGGTAFRVERGGDWAQLSGCFSFGYQIGFEFHDANLTSVVQCSVDGSDIGDGLIRTDPVIGFKVSGTSTNTIMSNLQTGGHPGSSAYPNPFIAVLIDLDQDSSPSNNTVMISNSDFSGFSDKVKVDIRDAKFVGISNCVFAAGQKTFSIQKDMGLKMRLSNCMITAQPGERVFHFVYNPDSGPVTNEIKVSNSYRPPASTLSNQGQSIVVSES